MNKKFNRMTKKDMYQTYGGFQMSLAIAIPLIIQSLVSTVSSIKMLSSSKGSVSYNGMKSEWSGETGKQDKLKQVSNEKYFIF